ncbi:hypothetical protein [Candidatus Caldatribacterium sp.]|uniref:hypothetical protein n=1 Tax=Candidatus Caldatribacterium sp. TaxID=2282143 RepID=UPI0038432AA9|nr:hypothetical protein [Candidatus Caldatribacterium sp.]
MRYIVDELGNAPLSEFEQVVIKLAEGLERAYYHYYQVPLRIVSRINPRKSRYWKALCATTEKLLRKGITDFELYCFTVIDEFHRRFGEVTPLYPGLILSDTGIAYYDEGRKRLTLPSSVVTSPSPQPKEEKVTSPLLGSDLVRQFLKKRGYTW